MSSKDLKDIGMKAGGLALIIGGIALWIWVLLIIIDILTFIWVYSAVTTVMEQYAVSEYLGKIVGVIFGALISTLFHTILLKVVKRDKEWIPIVSGVMIAWFVVMYIVSSPYTSGYFNPFSGRARATYLRTPDNKIKIFPGGLKFDHESGRELKELDSITAEEYQKQQGIRTESSLFFWQKDSKQKYAESKNWDDNIKIWIENIQIDENSTILNFACQGLKGKAGTMRAVSRYTNYPWYNSIYESSMNGTYIVNEQGKTYNSIDSTMNYNSFVSSGIGPWEKLTYPTRSIRVDEIYRFNIRFQKLPRNSKLVRLYLEGMEPALELDYFFERAEIIPPPPQPVKMQTPPANMSNNISVQSNANSRANSNTQVYSNR